MLTIPSKKVSEKRVTARERIKRSAAELFSRFGVDGVTIRDIAKEAGQKNGAAINYYFGSKDGLIAEVLDDAAGDADQRRLSALDGLEASGRIISVRDILKILIFPAESSSSMRLFTILLIYRRDLLHTTVPGRFDQAHSRCVVHLLRLLPDIPQAILRQRLYLLTPYLWMFLATKEGGESQAQFWKRFWASPYAQENFLDTAEGILRQPASADTLEALRGAGEV